MRRRDFAGSALGIWSVLNASVNAGSRSIGMWDEAVRILNHATHSGQLESAVLHVQYGEDSLTHACGRAGSGDAMFLLGSISKPVCVTALMSLYDRKEFQLDDPVRKFLPEFIAEGRQHVTIRHLLSHTSGLPDQVSANVELRRSHAPLSAFVEHTLATPPEFAPGSRYQYSSMGILLASRIAEVITGVEILTLVAERVLKPLEMRHSAQGTGQFRLDDLISCQADGAAPESGAGDPSAQDWNWNSRYWRSLGAPWGGTHASAPDLGRFLSEFLFQQGRCLSPETARLMIENHNPAGFVSRGLGFAVGKSAGSAGCSELTFGHTGSTGTLCWADPKSKCLCVVLTSLPSRGATPHPRELTGQSVAAAVRDHGVC